jgi:hypothetical protein
MLTRWMIKMLATLSLLAGASISAEAKPPGDSWLCAQQTDRIERREGIPARLLDAISLAETGRWDSDLKASFAWPWTVTSGGEGKYFPTKGEAVAEVRRLQAKGVRNIDVGCMQINLYYHGHAFNDLNEALDPASNVAYAAGFLKGLFNEHKSWTAAAGHYHSANAEFNVPYKAKVAKLWEQSKANSANRDKILAAAYSSSPSRSLSLPVTQARVQPPAQNVNREALRAAAEAYRQAKIAQYMERKAAKQAGKAS